MTGPTVVAEKAITLIEGIAATPDATERDATDLKIGEGIRQGDIYVIRVDGRRLAKRKVQALTERNLAQNTGTGHGHIAEGNLLTYPSLEGPIPGVKPDALRGLSIRANEEWLLKHDEHCSFKLPAGYFQVLFQLDWETRKRVED